VNRLDSKNGKQDQNQSKLSADQKFASADASRGHPANSNRDANSVPSTDHYVSRDDGLPDKHLSIFDRSNLDQADTSHFPPNSLYYLEHDNSQIKGVVNRPLQQRFRPGYDPSWAGDNKSAISGLNATTTVMGKSNILGQSMLNVTNLNMSKNT